MDQDLKYVLISSICDLNKQAADIIDSNVTSEFTVTYLRGKASNTSEHFDNACHLYKKFGIANINYCDLEKDEDEEVIALINNCDILHLGGGHTFKFANRILEGKYTSYLLNAITNAKLVVGESAGGIILTDNLEIANTLGENDIGGHGTALNRLCMSFLPHYNQISIDKCNYQTEQNRVIYGVNDGGAILIDKVGNKTLFNVTLR